MEPVTREEWNEEEIFERKKEKERELFFNHYSLTISNSNETVFTNLISFHFISYDNLLQSAMV